MLLVALRASPVATGRCCCGSAASWRRRQQQQQQQQSTRLLHRPPPLLQMHNESVMNVFDRRAKLLQRERAAAAEDPSQFDFIKEEIGYRLADRVLDIKRKMDVCVDLCSGRGHVTR